MVAFGIKSDQPSVMVWQIDGRKSMLLLDLLLESVTCGPFYQQRFSILVG
jgi:hypothetical protein